uniref:signal peptidase I n=1 Tax=Thaumasiovibrio occultus TaxID=1891184 RepID=UPI000B34BB75|nr:signal peptidase I [Thaumasiovibrio occultus]
MAAMFSLFLVILTFVTGVIWVLEKKVFKARREAKLQETIAAAGGSIDDDTAEKLAKQPWWIENAVSIFPVITIVLVLRSFIYEPFQIPSGSMKPTLLVGDFVLVEKFAYGLRDPVFRHKFIETGEPEAGDIVVFKFPEDTRFDYIKRVIGLPGDIVAYRDKQFCVQRPGESHCTPLPLSNINRDSGHFDKADQLIEFTETMPTLEHQILVNPNPQTNIKFPSANLAVNTWVVPEGHYFVVGDNRDQSADSRFWGFVPEANLVGKATAIWISFEFGRDESSAISWIPTAVRFNRIGGLT